MSWLVILGIVVVVVAVVASLGIQPKGGRPVGRTRLMWMARIALLVGAVLVVYLAWARRTGGSP